MVIFKFINCLLVKGIFLFIILIIILEKHSISLLSAFLIMCDCIDGLQNFNCDRISAFCLSNVFVVNMFNASERITIKNNTSSFIGRSPQVSEKKLCIHNSLQY